MTETLLNQVDLLTEEMIETIKKIVRINSIQSEPLPNMPYGKGVNKALITVLEHASALGFETENVDGHMGIVKYGTGEDYIAVIGHLDVVDTGTNWRHDPFKAEEVDGRIYGRGVLDNKGPILSCLYALYAIKQLQIPLKHPIWILFGTNEESGFHDLMYYLNKKKPPIMGFTPDCKYPVVYAERGRCQFEVDTAEENKEKLQSLLSKLKDDHHGDTFDLHVIDEEFGEMGFIAKPLERNECGMKLIFSYPASIDLSQIKTKLRKYFDNAYTISCIQNWNPVRFEKDSFLCETLQKAYETITGNDGTPVTTTGGTYAKLMPNIVPFGPSFPGQKGIAHLPDEWMDRSDIIKNAKIYALSLLWLGSGKHG